MDPTSVIDDAEFYLPPDFLSDEDFLVEKENNGGESNKCLFPYETLHGFDFSGGLNSAVKPVGDHAFPAGNDSKAWGMSRSPLCAAGIGYGCRNQRSNQKSSQAAAWDLYCAAAEEMARLSIKDESYGYNNQCGRGLLDYPRKQTVSTAKNPSNASGFYNHQSLPYQKLQAIQFQQLKQQQLMQHRRQLVQQSRAERANSNKHGGPVDLSPSAWSNQLPRRAGSDMRAVFLGDHTGKRGSTGTGVFLPRRVSHTSPATAETRSLATVLVPARVAQVMNLNLDESVVQPVVRFSASLNDVSWKQRSNNGGFSSEMKMEQPVNEPRLPLDWAY